ncbi:hypothetical protein HanXRQr2_Chr02g0072181 [Helianthus annuus]|uniref:Uncharacterized protein n=1 Tax=Helianthus annuus TaxID=4232 RepID=A0A9K3JQ46_HELAN|nr:hypothetical protein HanXRQr2_Chr02g0072181 [Helianthus annuus]KAJ0615938.1 hypothetical protein HanIR_Chr02g0084931 [Helianthus annuus]
MVGRDDDDDDGGDDAGNDDVAVLMFGVQWFGMVEEWFEDLHVEAS